ncbi:endonuclease/exonuclease/phosphatase family protein [Coraliomargarita parva]|uniref:endonuclease/exonuclease/phosphatase family protein n=1 Tax=Coraliomargarita parva TaxID=3014050 RepID=UPI0022B5CB4B|nr:endonuclease/exonuclease/phosphatase family protein [Coraliomargarita parva]
MKSLLSYLCVLSALCSLGAEPVRVATYNLQNYLVMDRMVDGQWRPAYPKPEPEKARIRAAILEVRPDILFLQEMGETMFLEELRTDLANAGLHYPYAVHFKAQDEVRQTAVLSRLAPKQVVKHRDLDFKYMDRRESVKRGLLEVSFEPVEGVMFRLFGVHLKSRWSDEKKDPESALRRVREAEACRDRVVARTLDLGERHYLVTGDFNDDLNSAPLRRFYQRGSLVLGWHVPATDSRKEWWTHYYRKQGSYTTVDGFILSEALKPALKQDSACIYDAPGVLEGSDHRMVYLDLDLSALKEDSR